MVGQNELFPGGVDVGVARAMVGAVIARGVLDGILCMTEKGSLP